ncbi:MAG: sugar-transfer associated ATP-grasp domain-containing protein [Patescibacteria group bacterium]|nr:sugar-transfer associated ATP-grasp domain-containing protein [Patescibacteria group bacterium]
MNARNLKYIRPYNLKPAKRLADDKMRSKRVLRKSGIPVPKLIGKIRSRGELDNFDFASLPNSFVLKPNYGFGGEGIVIVYGRKKKVNNTWIKADRSVVAEDDLKTHVRNILDGSFSRMNIPDFAFFEERIQLLKLFKPYTFKGIPDIRVIVFNKIPVMAMLRLPTEASGGTSNVHNGGIAVGIDMATGVTTSATQYNRVIEYVPKKRLLLSGIKIPFWQDILELAVKAQDVSGLGYLGADIAIDRERGPVFMEINARPGLAIQNANQDGLLGRLKRVEGLKIKTTARAVAIAQSLFGGEIEEGIEDISGKKIIGAVEKIKFIDKNKKEFEIEAKIDTGAYSTSIDTELAKRIGFEKTIDDFNQINLSEYKFIPGDGEKIEADFMEKYGKKLKKLENAAVVFSSSGSSLRPVVKTVFVMDKEKVVSRVNIIDRSDLKYPMIIGRKDLKKFLVEVSKK